MLNSGYILGTLLTSDEHTTNHLSGDQMMCYHQAVTSFRTHSENLMDEDKKSYFGTFTPHDEYYGKFIQSVGLHYMAYLDKYYEGLGDGGKDFTAYNKGQDFEEAQHGDTDDLSHNLMQAWIGLSQGPGQPYNQKRKGIRYAYSMYMRDMQNGDYTNCPSRLPDRCFQGQVPEQALIQ